MQGEQLGREGRSFKERKKVRMETGKGRVGVALLGYKEREGCMLG